MELRERQPDWCIPRAGAGELQGSGPGETDQGGLSSGEQSS